MTTLSTDYGMYKAQISHGDWNVSDVVFINQKEVTQINTSPHTVGLKSVSGVTDTGLDNCCTPSTH